jgi:hypothetical protein
MLVVAVARAGGVVAGFGLCQFSCLCTDEPQAMGIPFTRPAGYRVRSPFGACGKASRCRWNVLAHAGSAAQEVRSSSWPRQKRLAEVVLLKPVCPVPRRFSELCPDYSGIRVVAVRGDPVWRNAGDSLGQSKEGFGREVSLFTEHHIDPVAIATDRSSNCFLGLPNLRRLGAHSVVR